MIPRAFQHPLNGLKSAAEGLRFALVVSLLVQGLGFGMDSPNPKNEPFPQTEALMAQVARHQKRIETLLNQYTFTDTTTIYNLDRKGQVRSQHSDTYYITPTPYEIFILHVNHDGKAVSENDLQKQQAEIERKLDQDERKAKKPGDLHRKDTLLFAEIILKSRFVPLRWGAVDDKRVVVYGFEPKSAPQRTGNLEDRIAGDMKGKMWISPEDEEILRVEFASTSPLRLGMGFLGSVKGFEGYVEQRKVHDEVWLPSHQEYVASGRELVKGFRIREVSEYTDFLKASTDVFQQIHSEKTSGKDGSAMQLSSESHE